MSFAKDFLEESVTVISSLDVDSVEQVAEGLANVRNRGGRLFILGVGGSAGHASHAVNDFRKICGFEAYAPTDNVSELTARANDEGWDSCFAAWLRGRGSAPRDGAAGVLRGRRQRREERLGQHRRGFAAAEERGATSSASSDATAGLTAKVADACVVIPPLFRPHHAAHRGAVRGALAPAGIATPH